MTIIECDACSPSPGKFITVNEEIECVDCGRSLRTTAKQPAFTPMTLEQRRRPLCESLERLAHQMQDTADELHRYGGLEAMKHSLELCNASQQVLDWVDGILGTKA